MVSHLHLAPHAELKVEREKLNKKLEKKKRLQPRSTFEERFTGGGKQLKLKLKAERSKSRDCWKSMGYAALFSSIEREPMKYFCQRSSSVLI